MPNRRARASELVKLLDSLTEPVYVVDDRRRIVYCNRACGDWCGCAPEELLGQECRYHASSEAAGVAAVAAALAPPPDVFQGRRVFADVALPSGDATGSERRLEFVPLASSDEKAAGAIAFVRGAAAAPAEHDAAGDATSGELHVRIQRFRRQFALRYHVDGLLGDSPAMRRVRAQVLTASASTASVLVAGPPGSRRQDVARAIHYSAGPSACGPLVSLACGLLDVELLSATIRALLRPKSPVGPATLLLNDADQLPEAAQIELARLLSPAELPFRVVSTSRDPLAGRSGFRHDLACRLSTLVIELVPLAARLGDLPLLAQGLLEQLNAQGPKQVGGFAPAALDRLAAYVWPGDIDELAAMVRESHAKAGGVLIGAGELPQRLALAAEAAAYARPPDETIELSEFMASIERELIGRALVRSKGNRAQAARLLGISRPRLLRRLAQLGLEAGETDQVDLELEVEDQGDQTPQGSDVSVSP